jgi:hypothetical protein
MAPPCTPDAPGPLAVSSQDRHALADLIGPLILGLDRFGRWLRSTNTTPPADLDLVAGACADVGHQTGRVRTADHALAAVRDLGATGTDSTGAWPAASALGAPVAASSRHARRSRHCWATLPEDTTPGPGTGDLTQRLARAGDALGVIENVVTRSHDTTLAVEDLAVLRPALHHLAAVLGVPCRRIDHHLTNQASRSG